MKVKSIGANQTQIETGGKTILVSYETPVAAILRDNKSGKLKAYSTNYKWSVTTQKHINRFLESWDTLVHEKKDQNFFDDLLK